MLTAQASDTVEGDQNVEEQRQDAEVLFYTRRAVGSRCGHRDPCIHAHPLPAQGKANGTRMVACVSSLKQIWAMMMCALLLSIPSRAAGDETVPDWLKKPVYDRSVEVEGTRLNLATEKALENATVSDPDIFSVSLSDTETYRSDRSLALRLDSSLGDLHRTGTFQTPHSVEMWIPLPDGLDLTTYTNLYFRCKLTGSRAGYLAVSLVNLPVSWGKSSPEIRRTIVGVGTQVPIDRGGWSQYRMVLTGRGKKTLAACRYLFLRTQVVGHMPDEPAVSHIYLDDFVRAPSAAWCFLPGASPGRVRLDQPPVSSVALP